ncbi:hypothetical protein D0T53_11120 [Dysgonomonas sp. 216]|uniref:hypothetical protein n=1 Tax=Dysgonomonas sp. 216 TaxID=2302934 RepID=UPI0013D64526|nr:hypothetical protein [Dysgonomonas sp. 216]NDW19455.1 hypothetical protein [Dysgonomonas sp. 216]
MYWADITLAYEGNTGRIQIASDYGSWQNYWGACGSSFKVFLTKLEMEYTATKFGADDWFDLDATLKSMRSQIKYHQKEWGLSKADAKELFDEVDSLEDCSSVHEYHHKVWNDCDKLYSFFDAADFTCTKDVTPQFKRFWVEAWSVFINQIKEELCTK